MNSLYVLMVHYIDGSEFLGLFDDFVKARSVVIDLKKYKKCFGTEEVFKIYEIDNINEFYDYKDLEKCVIEEIRGCN